jgi:hypothetical protein
MLIERGAAHGVDTPLNVVLIVILSSKKGGRSEFPRKRVSENPNRRGTVALRKINFRAELN